MTGSRSEPETSDVQRAAWQVATYLDGAERVQPFGPEYDVAKVGGKIFMMTTAVPGWPVVTVKCAPERSAALRGAHPCITPGYHMNKRHWISIAAGPGISAVLIEELVRDSYELVARSLRQRAGP